MILRRLFRSSWLVSPTAIDPMLKQSRKKTKVVFTRGVARSTEAILNKSMTGNLIISD